MVAKKKPPFANEGFFLVIVRIAAIYLIKVTLP